MKRIVFGNRVFIPTGRPVQIGARPRRRLGAVEEYGQARKITIVVGQNKGKEKPNRTGSCALAPKKFSIKEVDDAFFAWREAQVGKKVAGTRVSGRGWYEGSPESSVSFDVSYIPPEGGGPAQEPTYAVFSENMNKLAEKLAEIFCQDSVLIVRDDGKKRSVAAAKWDPPRRLRAPRQKKSR